jgi:hypothetical protein
MIYRRLQELMAPEGGDNGGATLLTGGQPEQGDPAAQVQTNPAPPTNNPASGEGDVPGWISGLTSDLRTNPVVLGHKKPSDFVKAALEWKGKAETAIVKPGEGATPEEVAAYRTAMGIPADATGYELPESDLVGKEFLDAQRELYLQHGLTADQAKAVHEATVAQIAKGAQMLKQANVEARTQAEKTLKAELGDKYTQTIKSAQNALRRFATPELVQYLTDTGMGNNAELIKTFATIQEQIGGDSLLGGTKGGAQPLSEVQKRFPNSPEMFK